jgi:hypothetical protein
LQASLEEVDHLLAASRRGCWRAIFH